jgi:RNA polymerase sigma-54 factor
MDIRQQLAMKHQLVMTPQLQQAIKLLQLSQMELADVVQNELMENPMLEDLNESNREVTMLDGSPSHEIPEFTEQATLQAAKENVQTEAPRQDDGKSPDIDWSEYFESYSSGRSLSSQAGGQDELPSLESTLTVSPSLFDHLMWQVKLSSFTPREYDIAQRIIGNLNDSGYLIDASLQQISEDEEMTKQGVTTNEIEAVLTRIQEFDPVGVAARSLQESLLIQARVLGCLDEDLEKILLHHISNLEKKNYQAIAKDLKITMEDVIEYAKIITNFNPKPGRLFTTNDTHYVTPDVYVHKIGDKHFVVPNDDGMPKLKISEYYRQQLKTQNGNAKDYIQEKVQKAQWLIRSIQQRQRTIIKVTESIIKFQKEFFDKGISYLKPLILRDVAEDIGMHESTVSRVTTNKYVHTQQGIFELKYFFNSGINRIEGEDIASESVKNKLKQLIAQEDGKHPHSDQKLVELLKENDIDIARRTVAKYREMLGILPSSKRKKLF